MEALAKRRARSVREMITAHPYFSAAMLCVAAEMLTYGDQLYSSPASRMLVMALLGFVVYRLTAARAGKLRGLLAAGIAAAVTAIGIGISLYGRDGSVLCYAAAAAALAVLLTLYRKKLTTPENLTAIILMLAFAIYLSYTIYTLSTVRQTDTQFWDSEDGHAGYIHYLYDHWFMLPDSDPRDTWQFYHTPFYYMVCAALARIASGFGAPFEQAAEVSQMVSLFSGFCVVITSVKIFRRFSLEGGALTVAVIVISMCNATAMMSGSVSNDITAAAFSAGAFYTALCWYDSRKMSDILKTALCIGLGMMTKLSVWMAAPPVAFLFILVFIKSLKKRKGTARLIGQYAAFIGVCAPLALWFPVKNLIQYNIPLGYVPMGGGTMYIGEYPVWQRLFTVAPVTLTTPFTRSENFEYEYNPILLLMKSSLDLQRLADYGSLCQVLSIMLVVSAVLGIASFIFMLFSLFDKASPVPLTLRIYQVIFYFSMMIPFVVFCIRYPYTCTACIRYVLPVVMLGALNTGLLFARSFKKQGIQRLVRTGLGILCGLYAICFVSTFVILAVIPK